MKYFLKKHQPHVYTRELFESFKLLSTSMDCCWIFFYFPKRYKIGFLSEHWIFKTSNKAWTLHKMFIPSPNNLVALIKYPLTSPST